MCKPERYRVSVHMSMIDLSGCFIFVGGSGNKYLNIRELCGLWRLILNLY